MDFDTPQFTDIEPDVPEAGEPDVTDDNVAALFSDTRPNTISGDYKRKNMNF